MGCAVLLGVALCCAVLRCVALWRLFILLWVVCCVVLCCGVVAVQVKANLTRNEKIKSSLKHKRQEMGRAQRVVGVSVLSFCFLLLVLYPKVDAQQTIYQSLRPNGFVSFATAINQFTDLVALLSDNNITTVFAPTDAAWSAGGYYIPSGGVDLHNFLLYHITGGEFFTTNITAGAGQQQIINSLLYLPSLKGQSQKLIASHDGEGNPP